jgi:hypothetical protein
LATDDFKVGVTMSTIKMVAMSLPREATEGNLTRSMDAIVGNCENIIEICNSIINQRDMFPNYIRNLCQQAEAETESGREKILRSINDKMKKLASNKSTLAKVESVVIQIEQFITIS